MLDTNETKLALFYPNANFARETAVLPSRRENTSVFVARETSVVSKRNLKSISFIE